MVILLQRWRWILGATLAATIGILAALPFLTPQYEIRASLLYKLGREQAPSQVSGTTNGSAFKRPEDVTSEIEILKRQSLIEDLVRAFGTDYFLAKKPPETFFQHLKAFARSVVTALSEAFTEVQIFLGLERRLTPFEKVVSLLQHTIEAEAVKRADVIEVSLLMPDKAAGVDVMNKLLELYLKAHIQAYRTPGATQFLTERLSALDKEIGGLEQRRRQFSQQQSVWDIEEQRKMLLLQQRDLQTALARTREDLGRTGAEVAQAQATLKTMPAEKLTSRIEQANPMAADVEQRLVERRVFLVKSKATYGDDSRRVTDTEAEIKELETLLALYKNPVTRSETFEMATGFRDTEKTLLEKTNVLAGLQSAAQRQGEELKRIEQALGRLEAQGEEARRLQREISQSEQSFQLYARRLEEARISEALDAAEISNVSLLGPPSASIRPVRPRAKLLFLGALAVGLLGSIGLFLLRDAMRPAVHSRDRAAALLGAPVLARLPEVR